MRPLQISVVRTWVEGHSTHSSVPSVLTIHAALSIGRRPKLDFVQSRWKHLIAPGSLVTSSAPGGTSPLGWRSESPETWWPGDPERDATSFVDTMTSVPTRAASVPRRSQLLPKTPSRNGVGEFLQLKEQRRCQLRPDSRTYTKEGAYLLGVVLTRSPIGCLHVKRTAKLGIFTRC